MICLEERKTLSQWALSQNIRMLDESFYKDEELYTIQEYLEIVPRDVEVPLSNESESDPMGDAIDRLYEIRAIKKSLDVEEAEIKAKIKESGLDKITGSKAVMTVTYKNYEKFNDEAFINQLLIDIENKKIDASLKDKVLEQTYSIKQEELNKVVSEGELPLEYVVPFNTVTQTPVINTKAL